jgi:hypothetical protein
MVQDRDLGDESDAPKSDNSYLFSDTFTPSSGEIKDRARNDGGGWTEVRGHFNDDAASAVRAMDATFKAALKLNDTLSLIDRIGAAYAIAPCDTVILGDALQDMDRGEAYLQNKGTYAWYWAIGRVLQPRTVAEIGVRFGYSALAIAKGAEEATGYYGFDNESYVPGCLAIAWRALKRCYPMTFTNRTDTQGVTHDSFLDLLPSYGIDLFHIDGDHTYEGAHNDLLLALAGTTEGGYILIDDVDYHPEVRRAADSFCMDGSRTPLYLPTFRGLYIIPV